MKRAFALFSTATVLAGVAMSAPAAAETHRVDNDGSLQNLTKTVGPGDVIEVMGNHTYKGHLYFEQLGKADAPITIRGIPVAGKRPVIDGSGEEYGIQIASNHYVIENVEITGAEVRCVFHVGHDLTLRNVLVHDCPKDGLLSSDEWAGSLLVDRCEFYNNGNGDYNHQLYVTSNQDRYPEAVFRMQYTYVHDGRGGNNIKSRALRNEIYFNWIEGAHFHELELIGPDWKHEKERREDSDVVGNVIRKTNDSHAVRLGGDGTNDTDGRYRFVNNTFLLPAKALAPIRLFDGIESLELHNNAFHAEGGGGIRFMIEQHVTWARGERLIWGTNNYIPTGSTDVPSELTGTVQGTDPGFFNLAAYDLRPTAKSPLRDAGGAAPKFPKAPFPKPLTKLDAQPGLRTPLRLARGDDGKIDIGAYEGGFELSTVVKRMNASDPEPAPAPTASAPAKPLPRPPVRRCRCTLPGAPTPSGPPAELLLLLALVLRKRRR
jgi:hypothetical protein